MRKYMRTSIRPRKIIIIQLELLAAAVDEVPVALAAILAKSIRAETVSAFLRDFIVVTPV